MGSLAPDLKLWKSFIHASFIQVLILIKVVDDKGKSYPICVLTDDQPHCGINHFIDPMTSKFVVEGSKVLGFIIYFFGWDRQ